jgi:hypothetical protein
MCKRNEGESFDNYSARRKRERQALDAHLAGVVLVKGTNYNRHEERALRFKSIHHGSHSPYYRGR